MIDFILRPLRRNIGKDKHFFRIIDDMFGFIPHNIELYKLALIHKSASITLDSGQHINNERLEFLGDAVIETVTSDYLFIEFAEKSEGFLTQMRSKMVSRQSLNAVAKRLRLDEHVITNSTSNSSQKHIYGDAFEAMMGAIYLDQGYDFVNRLLINKIFVDYLKPDKLVEAETDFKSRLIEWCQKNHHSIHFDTSHDKTYSSSHPFFYSKILIDNIEVGYGAGESKKEAEQRAAFSVSQGFNDADYTKIMDKLDTIEAIKTKSNEDTKSRKGVKSRTRKPSIETDNGVQTPSDQPTAETLSAEHTQTSKTQQDSTAEVDSATTEQADAQNSTASDNAPSAKPRRATRTRRATKAKNESAETTSAEPKAMDVASEPTNTTAEIEVKPKTRTRRRRPANKATSAEAPTTTQE